jgi:uncharacterized protein
MTTLKWIALAVVCSYGGIVALLYLMQRNLMYFPVATPADAAAAGLAGLEELDVTTADGERLLAWHVPPAEGRPVIVFFHGNGGNLGHRASKFRALARYGFGLFAVSFRGFGGSSGIPTEAGLLTDAAAAYDAAERRYPGRLVVWGESLGTAMAVATAAVRAPRALILEAPFASALELAARRYPFVPVAWLMKDPYRSDLKVAAVRAPLLILHGDHDTIVPIASGERLFALATARKKFVRFAGGGHEDLESHGASAAVATFLRELE